MKDLYLILDTETANTIDDALCYDISCAVINQEGEVLTSLSFVVLEIFRYERDLMRSCYFSEKIPLYEKDIKDGVRLLRSIIDIRRSIFLLCHNFNIKAIIAHNAFFDYSALNNTLRYITKSQLRYFLPYDIEIWDTLKMARQVFSSSKEYKDFCNKYNFNNKFGKPKLTAEVLFRYLSNDINFIEKHTGDEDILIEKEIFKVCLKQNKNIEKKLFLSKEEKQKKEQKRLDKQFFEWYNNKRKE